MKNRAMLMVAVALIALLSIGFASAVVPNVAPYAGGIAYGYASYGSYPVNPSISGAYYAYSSQPVRIGGFYGQNSVSVIGLKPGVYDGPYWNTRTRSYVSDQYYPRIGGWFGSAPYGYGGVIGLRSGTFVYGGSTVRQTPNYHVHGPM